MTDIRNKEDIKKLSDAFYNKARPDELLGPIFNSKIKEEQWPAHLERINSFWNSVLLGEADYNGNPFNKHLDLPLSPEHFERWVALFREAIDENFAGIKADEAKGRAELMAQLFISKLAKSRDAGDKFIL